LKRRDLLRHLREQGCLLLREGGKHSVFVNPGIGLTSTLPRHNEINDFLVFKICRDLGIAPPKK